MVFRALKANTENDYLFERGYSFLKEAVYWLERVCGTHFRVIAPAQHSFFWINITAVASRWQHCVRFYRPKIWTSDLLLQKRFCYCSKLTRHNLLWCNIRTSGESPEVPLVCSNILSPSLHCWSCNRHRWCERRYKTTKWIPQQTSKLIT